MSLINTLSPAFLKQGVSVQRLIHATPTAVFDLLADPHRHQEIDGSGTVRGAVQGPHRVTLGSRFGMHMKAGLGYQMTNTVIEFELDRRIAWQAEPTVAVGRLLAGGRIWRYELEPVTGGTMVTETWDISQERIPLIVRGLRGVTERSMSRTLERMEQVL